MHPDEEQIERLRNGELSPAAEKSAREHLAACEDCRRRATEAEREEAEVHSLLRHVDQPAPRVDADAVAARARSHGFELSRAAAVLLAVGIAGAAYAVPGSPLRAWVKAVVERVGKPPDRAYVTQTTAQAPDPHVAGIAVAPGQQLLILFTSPQTEGQARVSLTDGAEVVVRAPIGAATFTSDVDRLVIDNRGSSATFEIQIPRAAPRLEIRVDEGRIFLKEGPRVTTGKSTGEQGPYLLPLTPSGS